MSVGDRLGRLLFIVPFVVHRDGVPLAELAAQLGVSPQQIEQDLTLLAMVGQPPLTPDHLIDLYVEDDVVYAALDQSLTRPLRLTHEEASALVLGAKLVGHQGGVGAQLEALLARIVAHLNPADRAAVQALGARVVVHADGAEGALPVEHAARLRDAIGARRLVEAVYYSASSDREKGYVLKPLALLTHGGVDYLVALDTAAGDHEKLFRLDRLSAVTLSGARFTPAQPLNLEKYRTASLYSGDGPYLARVRFAPHVARQVRERFAPGEITVLADGALVVQVPTSSAAWLTRWVLGFGDAAEVLSPPACRAAVHAVCAEAAALYGADTGLAPRGVAL